MATTTASNAGSLTIGGLQYSPEKIAVLIAEWDAATNALPNGDTRNLLAIPAGCIVINTTAQVTTVEGAADTVDVRCGTTVLINELDLNTLGYSTSATARAVPSGGEYINVTTGAAAAAVAVASVRIAVTVIDMRS
jgi:hypothetical protein